MINVFKCVKHYRNKSVTCPPLALSSKTILTGRNGCGKSTLLKALAGYSPFEGTIQVPNKVFYMPHDGPLAAQSIGAYYRASKGVARLIFHDCFKTADFPLIPQECSSGMRQKLRMVYALSWPADVYLFDEPLKSLDHASAQFFMRVLRAIKSPVIIVTHMNDAFSGWDIVKWPS